MTKLTKQKFVHLHVHSHYSLLDGLIKIDDLVKRAKELGMTSLALTDHGVMYGIIEFYQKAKEVGIKPIIGVEAYVAPRRLDQKTPKLDANPYHLVLLAKDRTGYQNLCQLTTTAHLKGYYYKPRIDWELLKKHSQGLIALSACIRGEIPHLLSIGKDSEAEKKVADFQDIFGKDNFFLEIQVHPKLVGQSNLTDEINQKLIALSKKTNAPLVATNDVHYLYPQDYSAHDILLCIQTANVVTDRNRLRQQEGEDYSFRTAEQMIKQFASVPEAISNTARIAERCNLDFKLGRLILPHFEVPQGETPSSYLEKLGYAGLIKRYSKNRDAFGKDLATREEAKKLVASSIIKRFDYELKIINQTGYAPYILIVWDFVKYAKEQGIIVGPGRGSAAGSIVSYVLNITTVDPLKYGLLFERFLNPARISPPDIDLDFADDRRDEVIRYVTSKYGSERVSQIITFGTMAARNAVRDVGRAMGMAYNDVDRIAKLIPFGESLKSALEKVVELREIVKTDPATEKLLAMAQKLEGVARHASTHAAGVVISKNPLVEYAPVQLSTHENEGVIVQYSMLDVEAIGLLKMDFLGLSNLTVIRNTLRIIKKTQGKEIDIDNIPLDDPKTFSLLREGKTTGVFQLESSGMKRYLKELKPTQFEDIIAMVALYRPGPMEWIPDYIKGKHHPEKVKYLHPKLEPILQETYGVAVYQEQILRIARDLAGFTLGEADVLRKAVGKKIKKLLVEQKKKFIDGVAKQGYSRELGEKLFSFIEPFAGYGFNKAHATCYAMVAYQTAYLKANYPAEFMAALLTSDQHNIDRVAIEVSECRQMGIKVLPPNVNESFVEFGVIKGTKNITFGLGAIKNLGEKPAELIVEERKKNGLFKSLDDFIRRVGCHLVINKKTLESLIQSGALDSLGERAVMLNNINRILSYGCEVGRNQINGQTDIFGTLKITDVPALSLTTCDPMPRKERLAWEKKLLGLYLSDHPLRGMEDYFTKYITPYVELRNKRPGERVVVGGIIVGIQKIVTRSNEPMLFLQLADLESEFEALIFPSLYKNDPAFFQEDKIIAIRGKISDKDGEIKILADDYTEITEEMVQKNQQLYFKKRFTFNNSLNNSTSRNHNQQVYLKLFVPEIASKDLLQEVRKVLLENQGDYRVVLVLSDGAQIKKQIEVPIRVNFTFDLRKKLSDLLGEEMVKLIRSSSI